MSPVHIPTKALCGAMLLGAATVGIAKLLGKTAQQRAGADTGPETHADAEDALHQTEAPENFETVRNSEAGRGRSGAAKAPYADGLSSRAQDDARPPGTPAPVEDARHGDGIGEPFSASVVGEVGPSAGNKGGLGDGGR